MLRASPTLGTLLRHLIELLDGEVHAAYVTSGLDWRPRYTPVLRALMRRGPSSIKALSQGIGISHSAVSQTVSQMVRDRLVKLEPGKDARERVVIVSERTHAMIPALQLQWAAINAAADQLDQELSAPLSNTVREAIAALERRPFGERIRAAGHGIDIPPPD